MAKQRKISPLKKVVDERFSIHRKRGGGLVRMEAWENEDGKIEKYGISYINPSLPSDENGRVLGYDNAHDYHHRHYKGEIYPVNDFVSYEDLVDRFSEELMEFVK
jgi:hypothetical protein